MQTSFKNIKKSLSTLNFSVVLYTVVEMAKIHWGDSSLGGGGGGGGGNGNFRWPFGSSLFNYL